MHMAKRRVIGRMDNCHEGERKPKLSLKSQDGLPRDVFQIQILVGSGH
jgi:hypothetical protein